MTDSDLIELAKGGSQDAFTELYRRHMPYVANVCRRITKNQDNEDLIQDVFIRAFTKLDSFKGEAKFSTWLVRITANTALMELRRRRPEQLPEDAVFPCEDRGLRSAHARIELARILGDEETLTPRRREVLRLMLEGFNEREMSAIMGLSLLAMKSRIHQAKKSARTSYRKRESANAHRPVCNAY